MLSLGRGSTNSNTLMPSIPQQNRDPNKEATNWYKPSLAKQEALSLAAPWFAVAMFGLCSFGEPVSRMLEGKDGAEAAAVEAVKSVVVFLPWQENQSISNPRLLVSVRVRSEVPLGDFCCRCFPTCWLVAPPKTCQRRSDHEGLAKEDGSRFDHRLRPF